MILLKNLYKRIFRYITLPEDRQNKIKAFRINLLIIINLLTAILMWSYAYVSYWHIDHYSIKYTGIVYAAIHALCLPSFKITNSMTASTYIMLISGGLFQWHFGTLSGGLQSGTLIWVAILPVLAGVLLNYKHAIYFGVFAFISVTLTIYFCNIEEVITNHISERGHFTANILATFGLVTLNTLATIFLMSLWKKSEEEHRKKAIAKQYILRILLHDVTNPLMVISNTARRLLKKDTLEDSKHIEKINQRSNDIKQLIELVKDMEAFETGKKEIKYETQNLKAIIENSVRSLENLFKIKDIKVKVNCDEDLAVLTIPEVIEKQILGNIITNAIKFSENGDTIFIEAKKVDNEILLIVQDSGIGMSKKLQNSVFDPLARTSRKGTNGEVGTGFGLPIAANSMEILDGRIEISSQVKGPYSKVHGTTFKLYFKAKQD